MVGPLEEVFFLFAASLIKTRIHIRSRVHAWYEEAAREVERDLSLDIQELEKVLSHTR